MPVLHPSEWPLVFRQAKELAPERLVGVFVGGCVKRGDGSSFRAKAHAHSEGEHTGWICYRSIKRINHRELAIHELAHVLTGEGHTDVWRAKVLELGGTLDATPDGVLKSYRKRKRNDPYLPAPSFKARRPEPGPNDPDTREERDLDKD